MEESGHSKDLHYLGFNIQTTNQRNPENDFSNNDNRQHHQELVDEAYIYDFIVDAFEDDDVAMNGDSDPNSNGIDNKVDFSFGIKQEQEFKRKCEAQRISKNLSQLPPIPQLRERQNKKIRPNYMQERNIADEDNLENTCIDNVRPDDVNDTLTVPNYNINEIDDIHLYGNNTVNNIKNNNTEIENFVSHPKSNPEEISILTTCDDNCYTNSISGDIPNDNVKNTSLEKSEVYLAMSEALERYKNVYADEMKIDYEKHKKRVDEFEKEFERLMYEKLNSSDLPINEIIEIQRKKFEEY